MTDNVQIPEPEREDAQGPAVSGAGGGGHMRPAAAAAEDALTKSPVAPADEAGEAPELQGAAAGILGQVQGAARTLAEAQAQWDTCNATLARLQEQAGAALKRGRELSASVEQMTVKTAELDREQLIIMDRLTAALTEGDTDAKRTKIAEDFRKAMQTGYWPGVVEVVRETVKQTHEQIQKIVLRNVTWTRWLLYAGSVALGLWGLVILALAIGGAWALSE